MRLDVAAVLAVGALALYGLAELDKSFRAQLPKRPPAPDADAETRRLYEGVTALARWHGLATVTFAFLAGAAEFAVLLVMLESQGHGSVWWAWCAHLAALSYLMLVAVAIQDCAALHRRANGRGP